MCRSRLRSLRDELFDFMWQNGHDFSNPAYQEARRVINGLLRLTSAIGPIEFLALLVRCSNDKHRDREFDRLDNSELKRKIQYASTNAVATFFESLFLSGAFGLFVRVLSMASKAIHFLGHANQFVKDRTDVLIDMANEFGAPQLTPRQQALLG